MLGQRIKRAVAEEEPQVQPTRGKNGRKGGKKTGGEAPQEHRRQFRQEKEEALATVLNGMGMTLEDFKQMDKSERRPILEAVKEQLPTKRDYLREEKKNARKEARKSETKGIRKVPGYVKQLKAIKQDETLTKQEKKEQKQQLKAEFIAILNAEREATTQQP